MVMPLTRRSFTRDEFHRMSDAGVFHEDDRLELVDGEVVVMTPVGRRHVACVLRVTQVLAAAAGRATMVSVQNPVVIADHDELHPDVALLGLRPDGYESELPNARDVLLLIEVAETSLRYDHEVKLPLYAAAGIPEVWIVNLAEECLEVCRQPAPMGYGETTHVSRGGVVRPLALPEVEVRVDEVLPGERGAGSGEQ
jgi:Uma2 family endonuclease